VRSVAESVTQRARFAGPKYSAGVTSSPRSPADYDVDAHVAAFNRAVENGAWECVVERFADDGVLEFVGPPVGPFEGREAIAQAYAASPPDDAIELVGPPKVDSPEVVVPYRWRRTGATGTMRFTISDELIARLVVTFD
jgi:steroid delta-isomerase